jgi:hypothetical protein
VVHHRFQTAGQKDNKGNGQASRQTKEIQLTKLNNYSCWNIQGIRQIK